MFLQVSNQPEVGIIPSFGSDTMRDDDLSSRSWRRDASLGETFPFAMAEILSSASAIFSNLESVFNRSLLHLVRTNQERGS